MTAVAYAHPTISRFAIADGMLHIAASRSGCWQARWLSRWTRRSLLTE